MNLLFAAQSGWGKSYHSQGWLEHNIPDYDVSVILDYKDEYRGLVQATNQSEQPEVFEFSHRSEPFVAQDMKVQVYLNAPYQVRFEDADGDGSEPTNALLEIPVYRGKDTVPGLGALIRQEMGQH